MKTKLLSAFAIVFVLFKSFCYFYYVLVHVV